ncbi:MAG: S1 RNA-binding domain-containing protein [Flavobacteriaceae bacterium]|nr:S1 RNA-binding domain-containing protein [Flavobacteriaceae bacterium]
MEKRTISTHKKANLGKNVTEIKEGDVVDGIVKNVVAFGAFVDIGLKNDGLVHISEISDTAFVKDPNDFLEVGQDVKVKVVSIDEKTGKVGLSMRI